MLNLLSNAIKFGKGKPIKVTCASGPDNGIVIEVIDQGVGIALEDHDKIFDEFVQLAKTTRQEGTGLGLPISKRLAEALGGSLTVTSEPATGSTFRLELPQHADRITSPRIRRESEPKTTVAASN
jgi:signal transduction histidine kinase